MSLRKICVVLFIWLSSLSAGTFNVTNYGAVGNGSANDTAPIQAAINAANSAGAGTVYFPSSPGCYMVTTLTFLSGLSYQGQNESVCIRSLFDNAELITTHGPFSNASISFLTLEGNGTVNGYDCFQLVAPTNVIIDHVTASGCSEDGFYITGYGANLATPGNGLLITNSLATNNGRNGLSIITGTNITVRNSTFQNQNKSAPYDGVDLEPNVSSQTIQNITFENCSFLNNGKSGISSPGQHGFNVWEAFGNLPNLNLRLINCTYSGNQHDGLYAAAAGYRLSGIYVIGGTMSNNQALNGYRGGVDIWNTSNVVISNLNVTTVDQAVFLWGVNAAVLANSILSGGSEDLNTNNSTNVQVYSSVNLIHKSHSGSYSTLNGNAPKIGSGALPSGTVGTSYVQQLTATGDATISWSLVTATGNGLPPGVILSPNGMISGTPTTAGTYVFTVQAMNSVTFDERTFTLIVSSCTCP